MRRSDREVTDSARIHEIIASCTCCRLGLHDHGRVYIVPLSFGYSPQGKGIFYFHSAKEGRKIDLLAREKYAGFELDTGYSLMEGAQACGYSARYQSVIGSGAVCFIEDPAEKRSALERIMQHATGKQQWAFPQEMVNAVCVFKLVVTELSCKEHL